MRAGPPRASFDEAVSWRDGDRTGVGRRKRCVVCCSERVLLEVLSRNGEVDTERIRQIATALQHEPGTALADIGDICMRLFPEQMQALMWMLNESVPGSRRKTTSDARLRAWAMQLLLGTRRAAGVALSTSTRWPRAWIVSGAVSRVAPNSRGTRIAQQGVLLLRLHHRQWPAPADDVAGWIDVDRTLSTLRSSRRRSRPDG